MFINWRAVFKNITDNSHLHKGKVLSNQKKQNIDKRVHDYISKALSQLK